MGAEVELTENQLRYRRSKGVALAWKRERELVMQGRGTRQWTLEEQRELIQTGRVKGYQGHHMMSVAKHPELADDPNNIQLLDARKGNNEHLKAHGGDYRNESAGRYNVKTGEIRPIETERPRAMNSYELEKKLPSFEEEEKKVHLPPSADEKNAVRAKPQSEKVTANGKTYSRWMGKQKSENTQSKSQVNATKASPKAEAKAAKSTFGEKAAAKAQSQGKVGNTFAASQSSAGKSHGASLGNFGAKEGASMGVGAGQGIGAGQGAGGHGVGGQGSGGGHGAGSGGGHGAGGQGGGQGGGGQGAGGQGGGGQGR